MNRNTPQSGRAAHIVADLLGIKREMLERRTSAYSMEPVDGGDWAPLPSETEYRSHPLGEAVDYLDHWLQEAGFDSPPQEAPIDGGFWSLGSELITAPIRSIHRGFLEPVRRVPLVERVPDRVVAFLIGIGGDRDLLDREHHDHIGWHYHYLDHKKSRSDVVLCWDTRALRSKDHPLFQEKHGEGHAKFKARPNLWADTKRRSIHAACAPDLDTWPLHAFRCASNKASSVWPQNTTLTPRPAQPQRQGKQGR